MARTQRYAARWRRPQEEGKSSTGKLANKHFFWRFHIWGGICVCFPQLGCFSAIIDDWRRLLTVVISEAPPLSTQSHLPSAIRSSVSLNHRENFSDTLGLYCTLLFKVFWVSVGTFSRTEQWLERGGAKPLSVVLPLYTRTNIHVSIFTKCWHYF